MIVIMPGGFHPFHAGHFALYQSAKQAFPNADVYVAATNDMSERPFPFALKEKLAKLAGVDAGHFIQVKSPFKAEEITKNYDPNSDVLVFVRSEKDRNEQPKPGGTKKDGSPAYFQPWTGKNLQPFSKHAYMAYLPTVEFGPGITSATQIRKAWPTLNDKRKTALVMSLYPAAQKNSKLAQNVVGMFDQVMGGQQGLAEAINPDITNPEFSHQQQIGDYLYVARYWSKGLKITAYDGNKKIGYAELMYQSAPFDDFADPKTTPKRIWLESEWTKVDPKYQRQGIMSTMYAYAKMLGNSVKPSELRSPDAKAAWSSWRQSGDAKHLTSNEGVTEDKSKVIARTASDLENPPKIMQHRAKRDQEREETYRSAQFGRDDLDDEGDLELQQLMRKAQQHYPTMPGKQQAFIKFVQRALKHSEEEDNQQDKEINQIKADLNKIEQDHKKIMKVSESSDYLEEK